MIPRSETYMIGSKFIDRVLLNHQPTNTNVTRISISGMASMGLTPKQVPDQGHSGNDKKCDDGVSGSDLGNLLPVSLNENFLQSRFRVSSL